MSSWTLPQQRPAPKGATRVSNVSLPFEIQRNELVKSLRANGIRDERVLSAFARVPREEFVPAGSSSVAYVDAPLPIGERQTVSQPYIVAVTLEALALTGSERVLDVGTGSGYAAALLACLAGEVYSIERIEALARAAHERLRRLRFAVDVRHGDGTLGWPEHAPYDAISVGAGGPRVPPALAAQLAAGGRLVIPVRYDDTQLLMRVVRVPGDGLLAEALEEVRFVPLIGAQGHAESGTPSRPAPRGVCTR